MRRLVFLASAAAVLLLAAPAFADRNPPCGYDCPPPSLSPSQPILPPSAPPTRPPTTPTPPKDVAEKTTPPARPQPEQPAQPRSELPATGPNTGGIAVAGLAAIVVGLAVLALGRKRGTHRRRRSA